MHTYMSVRTLQVLILRHPVCPTLCLTKSECSVITLLDNVESGHEMAYSKSMSSKSISEFSRIDNVAH